jgi:hypothetical protein
MEIRRPQTFSVYCIENLHKFDVPVLANDVECPYCGCTFVRLEQGESVTAVARTDLANVYFTESPPSWLSNVAEGGNR